MLIPCFRFCGISESVTLIYFVPFGRKSFISLIGFWDLYIFLIFIFIVGCGGGGGDNKAYNTPTQTNTQASSTQILETQDAPILPEANNLPTLNTN